MMYYFIPAGVIAILAVLFIGLWQDRKKACERLEQEIKDAHKQASSLRDELKSEHDYEIQKRDVLLLRSLTNKSEQYCLELLQEIRNTETYYEFLSAETLDEMREIIKRATE